MTGVLDILWPWAFLIVGGIVALFGVAMVFELLGGKKESHRDEAELPPVLEGPLIFDAKEVKERTVDDESQARTEPRDDRTYFVNRDSGFINPSNMIVGMIYIVTLPGHQPLLVSRTAGGLLEFHTKVSDTRAR